MSDAEHIVALQEVKNATNADRQRRLRKKRKARRPMLSSAKPAGRKGGIDVAAYTAAIALAGVAAWFSIRGMTVLFPGAPIAIIAVSTTMEGAKLVTTGWLARRWRVTAWMWRFVLVGLVVGLAVINATGVYAQLVAAHVGQRGAATSAIETQDATLAARIDVQAYKVADLDRRLGQIDAAIEEAAMRGHTSVALSAIEGQCRARESRCGTGSKLVRKRLEQRSFNWPPMCTNSGRSPEIAQQAKLVAGARNHLDLLLAATRVAPSKA